MMSRCGDICKPLVRSIYDEQNDDNYILTISRLMRIPVHYNLLAFFLIKVDSKLKKPERNTLSFIYLISLIRAPVTFQPH